MLFENGYPPFLTNGFRTHPKQFLNNNLVFIRLHSHYINLIMYNISLKGALRIGPLTSICDKQYNYSFKIFSFPP